MKGDECLNIFFLVSAIILSAIGSSGFSGSISQRGPAIAPEITESQKHNAKKILNLVYGDERSDQWEARRIQARASGEDDQTLVSIPQHELVYGELGLDALVTILDAVGVEKKDCFMDIGSGDGLLVSAASMLYSDFLTASMGVEIVPDLYERSLMFQRRLESMIADDDKTELCESMSFDLGNVYEPDERTRYLFSKTTLAVCFATTWSNTGVQGRQLPRLSEALGTKGQCELPAGARLVIIDGVLDHEKDGYDFGGQFELMCPDTAPFSIARLYTKL